MTTLCSLSGFASCVPETILTNSDMEARLDTSDEWIVSRTGIKARHILSDDETATDLAERAAIKAMERAGVPRETITHVLMTTCTPDYLCPSSACILAKKLGLGQVMAFDLSAACSGFIYGIDVARGLLAIHPDARILLVSAEALSRRLNWNDRSTCVLFGDGAGACVMSRESLSHSAILEDAICTANGEHAMHIAFGGGSRQAFHVGDTIDENFFLSMQGREVFKFAVRNMTSISQTILEKNNLTLADVDLFIPHQANLRIIEAVGDRLKLEADRVFVNVQHYGNTSAASIPLALAEALEAGRIKPGMRVLLATFGSGFTWGSALLRF